jgi:hypothetical protein
MARGIFCTIDALFTVPERSHLSPVLPPLAGRESSTGSLEGIVSAAYLMTPHIEAAFADCGFQDAQMPGRLFHPDYQSRFRFGAITMKPGMPIASIVSVLEQVTSAATNS